MSLYRSKSTLGIDTPPPVINNSNRVALRESNPSMPYIHRRASREQIQLIEEMIVTDGGNLSRSRPRDPAYDEALGPVDTILSPPKLSVKEKKHFRKSKSFGRPADFNYPPGIDFVKNILQPKDQVLFFKEAIQNSQMGDIEWITPPSQPLAAPGSTALSPLPQHTDDAPKNSIKPQHKPLFGSEPLTQQKAFQLSSSKKLASWEDELEAGNTTQRKLLPPLSTRNS
ncbi:hypothetical protein PROFUN_07982 [Planoprotostelium fungivorum]|uniref:Uncharacterized protein n=1 Tax=Planoprotostelium fungivorum TaxID=1890364 RepID=A0A2P6MVE4_9EUKA|nr:hypothetical protein PROFUN_07982 [Planoprotostelium fungivorum]